MTGIYAASARLVPLFPRRPTAKVVELTGLSMGTDEQQIHQAVNEVVGLSYEAVGVPVLIYAANPQPASRFSVGLNARGDLHQESI